MFVSLYNLNCKILCCFIIFLILINKIFLLSSHVLDYYVLGMFLRMREKVFSGDL